jgi:hypothetical protein
MTDYSINVGAKIYEKDLDQFRKKLTPLTAKDQIIIRMEAADAHQAGAITNELIRQGFDYQPHGGHGDDYYLIARRTKPQH